MEEILMDAAYAAGENLAEALRLGLTSNGLPGDFYVLAELEKIIVGSKSIRLLEEEVGSVGSPPKAIVEEFARNAIPHVLHSFAERLGRHRL